MLKDYPIIQALQTNGRLAVRPRDLQICAQIVAKWPVRAARKLLMAAHNEFNGADRKS